MKLPGGDNIWLRTQQFILGEAGAKGRLSASSNNNDRAVYAVAAASLNALDDRNIHHSKSRPALTAPPPYTATLPQNWSQPSASLAADEALHHAGGALQALEMALHGLDYCYYFFEEGKTPAVRWLKSHKNDIQIVCQCAQKPSRGTAFRRIFFRTDRTLAQSRFKQSWLNELTATLLPQMLLLTL